MPRLVQALLNSSVAVASWPVIPFVDPSVKSVAHYITSSAWCDALTRSATYGGCQTNQTFAEEVCATGRLPYCRAEELGWPDGRTVNYVLVNVNRWLESLDCDDIIIDDAVITTSALAQVHSKRSWCFLDYLCCVFCGAGY